MIELFEGVPGSGKSYYAVADKFLPAVRAGRRIYIYVDGIFLDRLARFTGISEAELKEQITVWTDPMEVMTLHERVEPRSLVVVDEAQSIFRAAVRLDMRLLRWLETHRHVGVDILMVCQDYKQMACGVTRLVESTIEFRRLWIVGLNNYAQARVRGNPEHERGEPIRKFTVTYDRKIYAYYSSYSLAAIKEEKRVHSIWKSARMVTSLAAGLFAVGVFIWRPWTSLAPVPAAPKAPTSAIDKAVKPAPLLTPPSPSEPVVTIRESSEPAAAPRITIMGTIGVVDGTEEERRWRYLLSTGEVLTAEQITGRYGLAVTERQDGALPRLIGNGVVYGSGGD